MATKKTTKKKVAKEEKVDAGVAQVSVAVGLTAAAVAAAGAYFLYGSKNADKNRKTVKSWALKAKAEVLEQLETAKKMSREEFEDVVAGVSATYAGVKAVNKKDLAGFADEMMSHWDQLEGLVGIKDKVKAKAAPKKKVAAKKKTTTKKTTTKKAPAKKAAPKKTTAKKTTKKTEK